MTQRAFAFPVLALGPDRYTLASPNNERFYVFRDGTALLTATRDELRCGARLKMLLVDSENIACRIASIVDAGPRTPLWHRILLVIFRQAGSIERKLECEFASEAPIAFEAVKARVWASIERNRDDWVDDEAVAGEPGEPLELRRILARARAAVDEATNVRELFDNLDKAWPY
jgi:hypothetical protein